jgi:hypothetical protein
MAPIMAAAAMLATKGTDRRGRSDDNVATVLLYYVFPGARSARAVSRTSNGAR